MIPCFSKNERQYYITAYGLAVQQGYEGTLEEWLDSLKGDDVELRYQDSAVQWRRIPGAGIPEGEDGNYPWQELFDVAELQGTVVAETLETATKAAEGAAISAAEAASGQEKAQDAALKAEMEARAASIYAQEAALSAQVVGVLPVTLTETDGVITADKTREQIWSAINNGIQVAVKYGYFHYGLSRIRTPENILRFTLLAASEADEYEEQIYLEVTRGDVWTKGTVEKGQLDGRYIAEYGVSTYADIYNAFTAGKSVYCRNGYYVLPMTFYQNQSNTARFSGTAGGEEVVWQVKTNEWSGYNAEVNGGGLTDELKTALINYYTHVMPNFDDANGLAYINAILTALGAETRGEPVEPEEPDTPEVTLSSISATYSGGDVAVGTAVTALTGVVVTAHYSDGTSETVTGYTLSGTIAEGSNTVTVSYGGKTATFTVTGVAESSGGGTEGEVVAMSAEVIHSDMHNAGHYSDGGSTKFSDARFPTSNGKSAVSENVFEEDTKLRITLTPTGNTFQCMLFCSTLMDADRKLGAADLDGLFYWCESSNAGFTYGWSAEEHTWEYTVKAGYKFGVITINAGMLPTKVEVV